jgi:hypothetical protein
VKKLLLACTALIALATAPASAVTITSAQVGQSGTQTFDGRIDDITDPVHAGISSSVTLTLTGVNTATNTWSFNYSATNTSTFSTYQLWGFGFNTNPLIQSASMTGSVFNNAQVGGIVDGGINTSSFCGNAGLNCLIGQGDGLGQGQTTTGTLTVDLFGSGTSFDMTTLFALYEKPGFQALDDAAGLASGTPITFAGGVPEPSTWAMMLLGFCGIVVMGAKRRREGGSAFRLV